MPIRYFQKQKNQGIRGLKDTIQTIRSRQTIEDLKLLERSKERQRFTLETVGEHVYLYSQKQIGDKCSCVKENIPKGDCPVCYGTGWVGGYDKYGYETINIGWHSKNVKMSNLEADSDVYPLSLKLVHGEQNGFLETDWYGLNNVVSFDNFKLQAYRTDSGKASITTYAQFGDESSFSDLSDIDNRIKNQTKVKFKFLFKKEANARPPLLELFRFRYQWMNDPVVRIEKGKTVKKLELTEQGFNDMMTNVNYVAMPEPKMYTTDFLEFKGDTTRRVKITEYTPMDPNNFVITVDFATRIIQRDEIYWKVF